MISVQTDGPRCDMKCPFCAEKVAGSPQQCPHCNKEMNAPDPQAAETKHVFWSSRIRYIIISASALAVAVGIWARPAGLIDTTKTRVDARRHAGTALTALAAGDVETAREEIELAVAVNSRYPEAVLSRAMVYLALGDLEEARRGANRTLNLLQTETPDPQAWNGMTEAQARDRGMLVASRIQCVARAGANSNPTRAQGKRLYDLMIELNEARGCTAIKDVIKRWSGEGLPYRIVLEAWSICRELWPCSASP